MILVNKDECIILPSKEPDPEYIVYKGEIFIIAPREGSRDSIFKTKFYRCSFSGRSEKLGVSFVSKWYEANYTEDEVLLLPLSNMQSDLYYLLKYLEDNNKMSSKLKSFKHKYTTRDSGGRVKLISKEIRIILSDYTHKNNKEYEKTPYYEKLYGGLWLDFHSFGSDRLKFNVVFKIIKHDIIASIN